MFSLPIILGSTRKGRQSHRVARHMKKRLKGSGRVDPEILDLREYDFPMLEERFRNLESPPDWMHSFRRRLNKADALVVVSPEYNHG